jgi:hypothetical protein
MNPQQQTELAIKTTLEMIKNWVVLYVDATVQASKNVAPADMKTMAAKIVQARLAKKASVARIALLLKKTSTDYKAIEAGTVMLSVDDAMTLAAYYGVDSGYFFY